MLAADPLVRLTSVPCPQLAQISQKGAPITEADVAPAREDCAPLREAGVDTVILGCTHYPFVRALLQRLLGPHVPLVTSGTAIARRVGHALALRDLATTRADGVEGTYSFLCTGDAAAFAEIGSRFLQLPMGSGPRRTRLWRRRMTTTQPRSAPTTARPTASARRRSSATSSSPQPGRR